MTVRPLRATVCGFLFAVAATLGGPSDVALAAADGCEAGKVSDFNGDGFTDTVVADPYATVAGRAQAGQVVVLYGDADGRIGEGGRSVVRQGAGTVGGVPEVGDLFGYSVAVADLDCDELTDLVVGVPNEDAGATVNSGQVQVIYGTAAGLGTTRASVAYGQSSFGMPTVAGDQFGFAVDAQEDVGQGGTPEPDAYALAIGVPGGNIAGRDDAGWVGVRHAVDGGNLDLVLHQDTPGVPGTAEAGDRFGAALTLNFLVRSGPGEPLVDLVVGAPGEDAGAIVDAGSITVVTDVYDGIVAATAYTQDSAGIPGSAEAGDRFGQVLDSVKVGSQGYVAVGVPGEDVGAATDAGSVQLFSAPESAAVLTAGTALTQDTAGVGGVAERGDHFGAAVAYAAPGLGDSVTRLAVSAPDEEGGATNAGAVWLFPLLHLDAEVGYSQDSPGVPGVAEAGDRFGSSLAVVAGPTERVLLVGVPSDVGAANGMVDVIPFGGGAPRAWVPGSGGVPAGGANQFGRALANAGF